MSLITSTAELKKYINIDGNTKISTMQPSIDEAELLYMVDLLSQEFYDEFLDLYLKSVPPTDPVVPLSDDNAKLLPYIQRTLAYYTQFKSINKIGVSFGEMGMRTNRNEESDPAMRWQIEKLQLEVVENGDLHADKLLEFLEKNATDSNDYSTWFESMANLKATGLIVRSTEIAMRHIPINNSRRLFLKILPKIKEIEKRYVPQLVGEEFYNSMTTAIINGNVTDEMQQVIDLLETIIAKRALYLAMPFLSVSLDADGVWLYSDVSSLRDRYFLLNDEAKEEFRCELKDAQLGFLADEQKLRGFLLENIDDYPEIKDSAIYTVQPAGGTPTFVPTNTAWNKHFIA